MVEAVLGAFTTTERTVDISAPVWSADRAKPARVWSILCHSAYAGMTTPIAGDEDVEVGYIVCLYSYILYVSIIFHLGYKYPGTSTYFFTRTLVIDRKFFGLIL